MSSQPILSTLVLAVIAIHGCALTSNSNVQANPNSAIAQVSYKSITSRDGRAQISIPEGWADTWQTNTSEDFNLKVSNHKKDLYLALSTKAKVPGLTATQLAEVGAKGAKATMEQATMQRTAMTKVGRYPATQYQLQGKSMGQDLVILITAIETPKQAHIMMVGGTSDSFKQNQSELNQIIESFKEVKKTAASQ